MSWLGTLGVLAVVVGVIAATGGFAAAPQARRSAEVGVGVDNGRARWTVRGAELTTTSLSGYSIEPSLRVRFGIVNTSDRTDGYVDRGVVELLLPDGTVTDDLDWRANPRSFALQPDVPADVFVEFEVSPERFAGATVTVRIHDQVPAESVVSADSWKTTSAATDVVVHVRDARDAP